MSVGTVFLILALFSLAGLGICHKLADSLRCGYGYAGIVTGILGIAMLTI